MPSGPKKRKAARRKKENQNNPLHGNDDLKSEKNEVEERGPSTVRQNDSDEKSVEEVCGDFKIEKVLGGNEDSVVTIKRDLKSEHIETAIESCYKNVASMSEAEKCDTGLAPLPKVIDLAGKMNEDSVYLLTNENAKDFETPKSSKNQPSNLVRKTSWWSCCGIFEALSGSDR